MKKILIISLTPVASEPRVIRQAEYLLKCGYKAFVAGFPGKDPLDNRWDFIDLADCFPESSSPRSLLKRLLNPLRVVRAIKSRYISKICKLLAFHPYFATYCYWMSPTYRNILDKLKSCPASLIICHDYHTSPVGYELSKLFHKPYMIDCHEHALTQQKKVGFFKNLRWFIWERNYVHGLQKKYLTAANSLTTVCDGIAQSIKNDYHLKRAPTVIRSVPFYDAQPRRVIKEGDPIKLLYHGLIAPGRGLESCIAAISLCHPKFSLIIRGSGDRAYTQQLQTLVAELNLQDRITFEPPVPFSEIVRAANKADIGIFVTQNISLQKKYALPNKFFEYIMAGLALCVSDLPEMAKIVKQYDIGTLVPEANPAKMAESLNNLTVEKVNYYKQQSLAAAKELCWEVESEKLGSICRELLEQQ